MTLVELGCVPLVVYLYITSLLVVSRVSLGCADYGCCPRPPGCSRDPAALWPQPSNLVNLTSASLSTRMPTHSSWRVAPMTSS